MDEDVATNELIIITEKNIKDMIYEIRGQKVMLDFDLAKIYGYETKMFNRQVMRNINKFSEDFMFQIYKDELDHLVRCQKGTPRIWNIGKRCWQKGRHNTANRTHRNLP